MKIKKLNTVTSLPDILGKNTENYETLWFKQLSRSRASMFYTDEEGYSVGLMNGIPGKRIYIAASDSTEAEKLYADIVCTGVNDEKTINTAVDTLTGGGTVVFMSGNYNIDSFTTSPDSLLPTAILLNKRNEEGRYIVFEGNTINPFLRSLKGCVFNVTQAAYDSIGETQVAVIAGANLKTWIYQYANDFKIKDIIIKFPANQKPIIGIDFRCITTGGTEGVRIFPQTVADNIFAGNSAGRAPIAHTGMVGIHGFSPSNSKFYSEFKWTNIWGCHEAFKIGGDHVMLWACSTGRCTYGFTFGTYDSGIHPVELYYCTDETNSNYPYFGQYANGRYIRFIDFQLERIEERTPSATLGFAKEHTPGTFLGEINWSHQSGGVTAQFWDNDGSGKNFKSRNTKHRFNATTAERNYWANMHIGQEVFDITLGKMIWWNGTAWKDGAGNTV